MKTATVRDIRTRFPVVEGWLAESGAVGITKAGKLVAKLIPVHSSDAEKPKLDFSERYSPSRKRIASQTDIAGFLIQARE